jgi:hypothetical protein
MTRYLIWWNSVSEAWTVYDVQRFQIVCIVADKMIERFAAQMVLPAMFCPWIEARSS